MHQTIHIHSKFSKPETSRGHGPQVIPWAPASCTCPIAPIPIHQATTPGGVSSLILSTVVHYDLSNPVKLNLNFRIMTTELRAKDVDSNPFVISKKDEWLFGPKKCT